MIDDAGKDAQAEKGDLVMPWLEENGWEMDNGLLSSYIL